MFATLQLFLGLGLGMGRSALLVDAVLTTVAVVIGAVVVTRSGRARPPAASADPGALVVAEAEAVTAGAGERQPA